MALIENRYKDNEQIFTKRMVILPNLFRRFSAAIFFLLSLQLIYTSSNTPLNSYALEYSSYPIDNVMNLHRSITNQISNLASSISELSGIRKENIALRLELDRLRAIETQAIILRSENKRLQEALKFKSVQQYKTISARLLSIATGPYTRSAIIDGGSNQGIETGQVVIHNSAVMGRIVEVTPNYSKMRLITDFTSRIPVVTEYSRLKGVLSGGNNAYPELKYIADKNSIELGETLVTSGDGEYFPIGLKVAKITKISDGNIFTAPVVDPSKIDFIEIIKR
jgi:rod shape-determining protein MreC